MANYDLGSLTSIPNSKNSYSVTPVDPTDVFEFDITGPREINLSLHDISAGDDADLYLYRDDGDGIFDAGDQLLSSSVRGSNQDDSINYEASAGTYFAKVQRYAPGSSGVVTYDLDLSATPTYFPSNLLPKEVQVGNLSGDTTRSGSVGNTDTADVFAFSLGLFEGVNIELSGLSADANIRVIQDSNNNDIVDSGEVVGSSTNPGNLSELISGIEQAGNYLLQVTQLSGNTNYQVSFDHYANPIITS